MSSQIDVDHDASDNAARKIRDARFILELLDFPRAQLNDRSALTLLALLDVQPDTPWTDAQKPLRGITPIMEWCRNYYGRTYAPNTRETFRRQTMHQFVEAALALANPDHPDRPINSPKWYYQIEPEALLLLRTFGTDAWEAQLAAYKSQREGLRQRYAKQRAMRMIPVTIRPKTNTAVTSRHVFS
jgi:adenine-specific DNA-methyltransferase